MVVAIVVVKTKVSLLLEVVIVSNEHNIGTILLLAICIINSCTYGLTKFKICIHTRVVHIRTIGRKTALHLLAHRVLIAVLTAQTILVDILPAPANLRTTLRLPQPTVGDVDLVGLGQVAVTIMVAVVRLSIHRTMNKDYRREALIRREGNSRREIDLGTHLTIEVEVEEQTLLICWLAVLHVNLTRDGLMTSRYRRYTLRHLDRVKPHTRRIVQAIGSTKATHDGTVLIENLRIGSRQTQHLDLACARDCVAITHRYRCRILKALGQGTACHLTQTSERDRLALDYSVTLDIVTKVTIHHYGLNLIVGLEREVDMCNALGHGDRVGLVTHIGCNQLIVTLHAIYVELTLQIGSHTDICAQPVNRSTEQCLAGIRSTHCTFDVLRHGANAH